MEETSRRRSILCKAKATLNPIPLSAKVYGIESTAQFFMEEIAKTYASYFIRKRAGN